MADSSKNLSQTPQTAEQHHFKFLKYLDSKPLLILLAFLFGGIAGYTYFSSSNRQPVTITLIGSASIDAIADKAVISGFYDVIASSEQEAYSQEQMQIGNMQSVLEENQLSMVDFKITDTNSYFDQGDFTEESPGGGSGTNLGAGGLNRSYPTPSLVCLGNCPSIPTAPVIRNITSENSLVYHRDSTFEVTLQNDAIENIDKYMKIISNSLNSEPQAVYYLTNSSSYRTQLQEMAIVDARKKAENIAMTYKTKIKRMLSVEESGYSPSGLEDSSYVKQIKISRYFTVKYELNSPFFQF